MRAIRAVVNASVAIATTTGVICMLDIKATVEVQERTGSIGDRTGITIMPVNGAKGHKAVMVDDKQQITAVFAATLVEEVSLYIPVHISLQDTNMPPCTSSSSQENGT